VLETLPGFAELCLKIRTKAGAIEPLVLNRAQAHVHARLEDQKARTGKVRALILKARQQGFSTYIQARFFWRIIQSVGWQAYILAHEQDASDTLLAMVRRFHEHCPPGVRPGTGAFSRQAVQFDGLDSGYATGAAGALATGRSRTVQLLHGSEAAFWKNAADHFAGVLQCVPDAPGTEVLIESTGNGPSGEFYERWQRAEAGVGDYEAIFVPWFWTAEYRRPPPDGFALDPDEAAVAAAHELDLEQMAWRRAKMAELKDPLLFMQEYPSTPLEAFQASAHDSFIPAEAVLRARKASCQAVGPLILGVDPKREGLDRFAMAWRQGRRVLKVTSDPQPVDAVTAAGRIKTAIDADRPVAVFIDVGGPGGAIADVLKAWGEPYASRVKEVNFGSAPLEAVRLLPDGSRRPGPKNRRAEMWEKSRDWLEDPGGADLPDLDSLQADACAPGYGYDLQQRLVLESKERMAARGARSPDEWDAVALTFAEPVADPALARPRRGRPDWSHLGPYPWMAN
jgi:hypothetical protein